MTYMTWQQERQSYNEWEKEFIAICSECGRAYDTEYMFGEYCAYCYGVVEQTESERHEETDTHQESTSL